MNTSMVETASQESLGPASSEMAPPPPPPPTQRRPRVRIVSSRFMSPVVPSSSSGDLQCPNSKSPVTRHAGESQSRPRSVSAQRRRQLDLELPLSHSSENNRPETARSLETPLAESQAKIPKPLGSVQRKHQRSASLHILRENGGRAEFSDSNEVVKASNRGVSRCDTPIVSASMDRMASSRIRNGGHNLHRSISNGGDSAAAKLLHLSGMSLSGSQGLNSRPKTDENNPQEGNLTGDDCKDMAQMRSSMPEADMLMSVSVSNRLLADRNGNGNRGSVSGCDNSTRVGASPMSRSLNSPLCDTSSFYSIKGNDKLVSKQCPTPMIAGRVCLPPVPPGAKVSSNSDGRRGKKGSSHQEDVHSLRLLHNHYLQWIFANAKSEVSIQVQKREAESMLYALSIKIAELYDSVIRKRVELGILRRMRTATAIVESQMPWLVEWSALEGDYSTHLSEVIQELTNASVQLPIGGNTRADIREVGEALNSAAKMMEGVVHNTKSFMPKAEELDTFVSELARVAGGEKHLIEECGDLLSKMHSMQVDEWSLRAETIQLHRPSVNQYR